MKKKRPFRTIYQERSSVRNHANSPLYEQIPRALPSVILDAAKGTRLVGVSRRRHIYSTVEFHMVSERRRRCPDINSKARESVAFNGVLMQSLKDHNLFHEASLTNVWDPIKYEQSLYYLNFSL